MSTPDEEGRPVEGGRGGEPVAPTGAELPADEVFEAEILTDVENDYVSRWLAHARTGKALPAHPRARVVRRAVVAARRPVAATFVVGWRSDQVVRVRSVLGYRVRKAPLDLLRLLWFVLRGHGRWIGKAWTFFTYGDLRADARAARLAGDAQTRRQAQELIRADSRARWARLAMFAENAWRAAVAGGVAVVALWLIDSMMTRAEMSPWLAGLYDILGAVGYAVVTAAPIVATATAVGWLVATAREGRDLSPGAGFLVRPDRADPDSWVDERMISQALGHLGIAPMDRFFKNGGELVYTVPARLDGDGTFAQVRLPMGVTADMVADRRDRLAANLGRAKLETWPTEGSEAGQLDLWIADKGRLGRGAGPWPLLTDGQVDVFEGVPFGRSNAANC
jgi:S-DNA-T family DNA segregation ATPase FtsK/SpoIIIE